MAFLSVKNIVKKFDTQTALNNVNVDIEKGELVSILGPSGCGKTTLLRIIAGLETPDMGQVFIDGKDCTQLPPSKRNFGIVFQSYALFPHMTVAQKLMFGLNQQKHLSKEERKERAREVLEMVDLYDHRKKYPSQLSGGQQQRIALARAISLKPAFLLLDEPLSALDAKVRVKLRAEIRRIQKKLGITTILVTHDQEEALTMADKIVVMNNAVVEQIGTPKEIYNAPKTAFTAQFIGTMNLYQQDRTAWGVRPELIGITRTAKAGDPAYLKGTVEEIEFRGALTRIYGRLEERGETVCADMDSHQEETLCLKEKEEVFFHIPQSGIIRYPGQKGAERNTA